MKKPEGDLKQKSVPKSEDEIKLLINRLKRIEGQIRGIQNMVTEDRYCIDILTQISSVISALENVNLLLLERHTKKCMKQAYRNDREDEAVEELMDVIKRMIK
ncbi:metal-sensitive transcriptional regulator [Filifactor villosus]|uniref:Metal-sensitive transcriptional regulator n=1 Tax=Filifactor villosus TaxID=29374 RepID=A0ABV9QIV7_9FIRM